MEFVVSDKGKRKVVYNGYVFVKQKQLANGITSYECEKRRQNKEKQGECKAKLKLEGDNLVGVLNEHTHGPQPERGEVLKLRNRMKVRAENTQETAQQIISTEVGALSQTAAVALPAVPNIRRCIRRYKQQVSAPLPLPSDRSSLVIPDEYKSLSGGEQFLLYDSGVGDGDRMLIFATAKSLQLLRSSMHWFMDGTFKIVPQLFYQLYSIHSLVDGRVIPCIYALLPNKTQATYMRLLQHLVAIHNDLKPRTVLTDFELAAMNVVSDVFPDAQVLGCFYHLSQNVYRKLQATGLQERYQTDEDFAVKTRMITAIAFVPVESVENAFEALQEVVPDELMPVLDYFEDTYIGRQRRRRRAQPIFDHKIWNMYERAVNELPRTNNNVEGWHRKLQSSVSSHHPNIWKFLDVLRREQDLNNLQIAQLVGGHAPEPQRKKYKASNERIVNIVRDFSNRSLLDYMRGIAHNITI